MIEQHAGALPTWLAPVQAVVCGITGAQDEYVQEVVQKLKAEGIRATSDLRGDKITLKIREHALQKVPYILVAGDKEKASASVAVRARGNQDLGVMSTDDFMRRIVDDIGQKT